MGRVTVVPPPPDEFRAFLQAGRHRCKTGDSERGLAALRLAQRMAATPAEAAEAAFWTAQALYGLGRELEAKAAWQDLKARLQDPAQASSERRQAS